MVKQNFESDEALLPQNVTYYYLDLLTYRPISNAIAEKWHVHHQSPQILLIKGEACLYHTSHENISAEELAKQIV